MAGTSGTGFVLSVIRQRLFAVLAVSLFLAGLFHSFYFPYITLFGVREVGMGPMALGVFLSVSTIGSIAASTVIARISDAARSRKRVLLGVLVCGMAGYPVFAFSRDYAVLLLTGLLVLSFSWATFPQLFAFAGGIDVRGMEKERAFVTGVLRAVFAAGWVVGPPIGAFLLERSGFAALYLAIAAIFAVLLALAALFIEDRPRDSAPPAGRESGFSRKLAVNAAGFCAIFLATSLGGYAFPLFVMETLGAQDQHLGWLLGLAAALEIPLMIAGSFLVRRLGTRRLITVGFAGFLAYAAAVFLASDLRLLYPAQLLNALAVSQIMSIGIAYFQELDPARHDGHDVQQCAGGQRHSGGVDVRRLHVLAGLPVRISVLRRLCRAGARAAPTGGQPA